MLATGATEQRPDAVVWVDEEHAIVAQRDTEDRISTVEIRRWQQAEPRYLASVVHELGSHEHVLVIGRAPIRLALERRFVAVTHRPERLMATSHIALDEGTRLVNDAAALAA